MQEETERRANTSPVVCFDECQPGGAQGGSPSHTTNIKKMDVMRINYQYLLWAFSIGRCSFFLFFYVQKGK